MLDTRTVAGTAPFDRIAPVAARLPVRTTRLSPDTPPSEHWGGLLFRVRDQFLLAPLDRIAAVLAVPDDLTPLPGAPPWVVGVAVHGCTLLPIIDLEVLLHGGRPIPRKINRLLVVRHEDLPYGLVASEVLGIRHCAGSQRLVDPPVGLGVLAPFAQAGFPLGANAVPIIELDRLLEAPLLRIVAT
ncbi:MAG TPA: chemotaxis protein CheW [Lamprocystis sp. (in: g-proteobacteria)]|nr:chemotaxis protein CheW [Lamprocystis sp. (in: g-proteobacteria)]